MKTKLLLVFFTVFSFSLYGMKKLSSLIEIKKAVTNNNATKMQLLQKKGVRVDAEFFDLLEKKPYLYVLFFSNSFFILDDNAFTRLFEITMQQVKYRFSLSEQIQFIKQIPSHCKLLTLITNKVINVEKIQHIFLEDFFKNHSYMNIVNALSEYMKIFGALQEYSDDSDCSGDEDYQEADNSSLFLFAMFPLFNNYFIKKCWQHNVSKKAEEHKKILLSILYNNSDIFKLVQARPSLLEEFLSTDVIINKKNENTTYMASFGLALSVCSGHKKIANLIINYLPPNITNIWKQVINIIQENDNFLENFSSNYITIILDSTWDDQIDEFFLLKHKYEKKLSKNILIDLRNTLVQSDIMVKDLWIKNEIFNNVFQEKDVFLLILSFLGYDIVWMNKIVTDIVEEKKYLKQREHLCIKTWYLHNQEISFEKAQKFIACASHAEDYEKKGNV